MEYKLTDARKQQYDNLLASTQQLEMTIGSNQFRIQKLLDMRKELDGTLKKWWDEVIKELNIDEKRDYMITNDGTIKDVTQEAPKVEVAKPKTVDDLK